VSGKTKNKILSALMEMGEMNTKASLSIAAYSVCSASMLVVNKVAVYYLPSPGLVTLVQLIFCSVFLTFLKYSGTAKVDDLSWEKTKPYIVYVAGFTGAVYCNMRALSNLNVETVIVFRACTPLVVCFLDTLFLGRMFPSNRSLAALAVIVAGAVGYVQTDAAFARAGILAYGWCFAYVSLICFEMILGKWLVKDIGLTLSGSVWYTNVLSVGPMMGLALIKDEYSNLYTLDITGPALLVLLLSCIVGTGISYAGWWCRSQLSATSYTLVGVMNKVLSILLNIAIWDKHATLTGIFFLTFCLAGGAAYKQSPLKNSRIHANELSKMSSA